jgi:hypothetical protein
VKASHTILVPKMLAQIMSLARPRMRLKKVQTLIVCTERSSFFDSDTGVCDTPSELVTDPYALIHNFSSFYFSQILRVFSIFAILFGIS